MSEVGTMRITAIIEDWHMGKVHKLREDRRAKKLKRGQCLIAFNRKMTIGRIIDPLGGVHTYYAAKKSVFDVDALSAMVADGFWVELKVGSSTRKQASELKAA